MSGSRAVEAVAPPGVVPGEATRRYLRALAERRREDVDWSAAPPTYKRYRSAGRVVLPWREPSLPGDLLRGLLGVTRAEWAHRERGSWLRLKRPAPSGGGLYPVEAYVALGEPAGLYHYDAAHHALDLVRPGDHRAGLRAALASPPAHVPDVVVVLTAVFWRNGFKYREFAYRLQCQEVGVLGAQALALSEALDLDTAVHLGFDDATFGRSLGLDPAREGVLAAITCASGVVAPPGVPPQHAVAEEERPPPAVTDLLPHLTALHAAASGPQPGVLPPLPPVPPGPVVRLPAPRSARVTGALPLRASPEAGFLRREITAEALAAVLARAAAGYPGDLPGSRDAPVTLAPHVLVQRVAGVPPGAYRYDRDRGALVACGGTGDVLAGPLQLNTRLALPEAAAVLVPVGDQVTGSTAFGDRWYRLQQAEAGLVVHRATLAAAALGLAARIHSDGTNAVTDAALGLAGGPSRSLSFLLLGFARPGATLPGRIG